MSTIYTPYTRNIVLIQHNKPPFTCSTQYMYMYMHQCRCCWAVNCHNIMLRGPAINFMDPWSAARAHIHNDSLHRPRLSCAPPVNMSCKISTIYTFSYMYMWRGLGWMVTPLPGVHPPIVV